MNKFRLTLFASFALINLGNLVVEDTGLVLLKLALGFYFVYMTVNEIERGIGV